MLKAVLWDMGGPIDREVEMTTVLFRTRRHAQQQPRTWEETPDHEAETVPQLDAVLRRLGLY